MQPIYSQFQMPFLEGSSTRSLQFFLLNLLKIISFKFINIKLGVYIKGKKMKFNIYKLKEDISKYKFRASFFYTLCYCCIICAGVFPLALLFNRFFAFFAFSLKLEFYLLIMTLVNIIFLSLFLYLSERYENKVVKLNNVHEKMKGE